MDKLAQDKRWQALTKDGRQARIASYQELLKLQKSEADSYLITIEDLEKLYGKHNLNPKQIKTWEDVERAEGGKISVDSKVINPNGRAWGLNLKFHNKAEATLKLAILIDLGYGGMVSEEEWEDDEIRKYVVKWCAPDKHPYNDWETRHKYFIAFHTPEQREEFMSHESNRQLVNQYYLM